MRRRFHFRRGLRSSADRKTHWLGTGCLGAHTSTAALDARPICLPHCNYSSSFSPGRLRRASSQTSGIPHAAKLGQSLEKVQVNILGHVRISGENRISTNARANEVQGSVRAGASRESLRRSPAAASRSLLTRTTTTPGTALPRLPNSSGCGTRKSRLFNVGSLLWRLQLSVCCRST